MQTSSEAFRDSFINTPKISTIKLCVSKLEKKNGGL
jgi:phosphoserine aminotransferase